MMIRTKLVTLLILIAAFALSLAGQEKPSVPAAPGVPGVREFPVTLKQSVTAGKTAVGTKIEAELAVATLVDGKVIPRYAVLSGEVIASSGKSKTDPSRLGIRIDAATWKGGGTAPLTAYLTAWYYPTRDESGQDLQYGPEKPASATWDGRGAYPTANERSYKPFPTADTDKSGGVPDTKNSTTSNHPVTMKDVESESHSDGTIDLVCKRSNLKLDKLTTYVFASGDVPPAK
jgi:hypothetical protein